MLLFVTAVSVVLVVSFLCSIFESEKDKKKIRTSMILTNKMLDVLILLFSAYSRLTPGSIKLTSDYTCSQPKPAKRR